MNNERFMVLNVILDRMTNKVGVEGNLDNRAECIKLLATGIVAITNMEMTPKQENKIIKPVFVPPRDVIKK